MRYWLPAASLYCVGNLSGRIGSWQGGVHVLPWALRYFGRWQSCQRQRGHRARAWRHLYRSCQSPNHWSFWSRQLSSSDGILEDRGGYLSHKRHWERQLPWVCRCLFVVHQLPIKEMTLINFHELTWGPCCVIYHIRGRIESFTINRRTVTSSKHARHCEEDEWWVESQSSAKYIIDMWHWRGTVKVNMRYH